MSNCDLVTGGAGFIGSHLVRCLLDKGRHVVAVDSFNDYYDPKIKRRNAATYADHPNVTLIEADLADQTSVDKLFADHTFDAIAHLGAYGGVRYSIGRAELYTQQNFVASIHLLEAARLNNVEPFVFASTSSVYGKTQQLPFVEDDPCNHPLAPYPASKKAVELMGHTYHNLHGMHFTAVRFFSVYGPAGRPDMMPFMVMDRIVKGETITLFDAGNMQRDWTYVGDIVEGIAAAMAKPVGYQVINLGRGEPIFMSDFVQILESLIGKKAVLETPDAPASEPKVTFANIDKARNLLGYDPKTDVQTGLEAMWQWYQDVYLSD